MRAIDTLYMAQLLLPHEYSHKLSRMCELFGITCVITCEFAQAYLHDNQTK